MLKLKYGLYEDSLSSGNGYFDNQIDESCIESEFGRRVIKDIIDADVLDKNTIIDPIFGSIPSSRLPGGIKALLILKFGEGIPLIDVSALGDNCLPYLLEIAKDKDLEMTIDAFRLFPEGNNFRILFVNTGKIVTNNKDLVLEMSKVDDGVDTLIWKTRL